MQNINSYNQEHCREYCKQLDFFNQIESDFDYLIWSKTSIHANPTPREKAGSIGKSRFSMVPFYYLEKLLEKNPTEIYDLGCGWNIFKRYIPKIIGVSPSHDHDSYADIHDIVGGVYVNEHQNYFESVFSINALHYKPLEDLENIVTEFVSMIKPGGRGFLSLNMMRLIEQSSIEFLEQAVGSTPSSTDYEQYVLSVLEKINIGYLIVDVDFSLILDEYMDGNIRLVFEKE